MRILLGCAWLLLRVAGAAWHYGPGQGYAKLDRAAATVRAADLAVRDENYAEAVALYEEAIKALPADRVGEVRKLRVQKAKAHKSWLSTINGIYSSPSSCSSSAYSSSPSEMLASWYC